MPPPDILATLALAHPEKPAVIDDRPDGTVIESNFEVFNREVNRLANVLLSLGVKRGEKVVWCGMNSIGVVRMMHATRKAGAGAVPLNYRLTAEEAAYVVDNCDAAVVYADADFAELMSELRPRCSKVREWLIFDGPAPQGMTAIDPCSRTLTKLNLGWPERGSRRPSPSPTRRVPPESPKALCGAAWETRTRWRRWSR